MLSDIINNIDECIKSIEKLKNETQCLMNKIEFENQILKSENSKLFGYVRDLEAKNDKINDLQEEIASLSGENKYLNDECSKLSVELQYYIDYTRRLESQIDDLTQQLDDAGLLCY